MASSDPETNLYRPDSGETSSNNYDNLDSKTSSSSELANQESSAPNFIPGSGSDDLNFTGGKNEKKSRASKVVGKLFSFKRRKLLLIAGIAGGGGVVGIILILFLFAAFFKVPGLSALIIEQQFARMQRQSAAAEENVTEEKLAVDAEDSFTSKLESTYQGLRDATWGKLDNYRPSIVIQNLKQNNGFALNYDKTSITGKPILTSVELDGQPYEVATQSLKTKFIPVVSNVIDFKNQVGLARDFAPALEQSLESNEIGPIIRFAVAGDIRQQLGIGLIAWNLGKFQGKSASDARIALEQDAAESVSETGTPDPVVEPVSDAATAENTASLIGKADIPDPAAMAKTLANGGVDPNVTNKIVSAVQDNFFKDAVGIANPLYAVAVPACIVYDGSMEQAGPGINNQTQAQEKAFYFLESAADEQKAGGPNDPSGSAEATAVGAMNAKLGNISQSNPYIQANGQTVVDTSNSSLSAETSPTGDFTLLSAAPPPLSTVAPFINEIAVPACSVLTNVWSAVGVVVLNTIISFFTGGEAEAEEETIAQTAKPIVDKVVTDASSSITSRIVSSILPKATSGIQYIFTKARAVLGIAKSTAKQVALVSGITLLAKLVVMDRAGAGGLYSGTEQGADFVNEADSGANIQAGELERQQLFGRALTCAEVTQSNQSDQQYIADLNQSKSFSNRYLALSNPDSMLSHVAMAVSADTNGSLLNPLSDVVSNFLSGPFSFSTLIGAITGVAHADPTCGNQDYGNVQFGWSEAEEGLIKSDPSYMPLENQLILDKSNQENAIAKSYSYCFGYDYNSSGDGSLDPTDPSGDLVSDVTGLGPLVQSGQDNDGSIGGLLAHGDIIRDSNGGVMAAPNPNVLGGHGHCSPIYLSYDSPDPLAYDNPNNLAGEPTSVTSPSPQTRDLIFRWRIAMSYDTSLDQLSSMQSVTN